MSATTMKRLTGLLNRSKSSSHSIDIANAPADSPEANVTRAIKLFCEAGNSSSGGGDEVLHLPVIVDGAESSPRAATAAAQQIRKFLSREYAISPSIQYNAIMLIRILSDHPGPRFTANFDKAFVATIKECLRGCRDYGTQQILRETLDSLEVNKANDEGMQPLLQMWRKEKGAGANLSRQGTQNAAMMSPSPNNGSHTNRHQLPPPAELATRIEEAKNTAQILLQFVQTTRPEELYANDLIGEFGERCQIAQKSMQGYIKSTNPYPDDDTMQTLIEVNEQLSLANSRFHRALLAARRAAAGQSPPPQQPFASPPVPQPSNETYQAPLGPPPRHTTQPLPSPPFQSHNPFADPSDHQPQSTSLFSSAPPVKSFNIQAEPAYPSNRPTPRNPSSHVAELENNFVTSAYSRAQGGLPLPGGGQPPPSLQHPPRPIDDHDPYAATPTRQNHTSDGYDASPPRSVARPAMGAWHQSGVTNSYVGRQDSAANNLTMHGAQGERNQR